MKRSLPARLGTSLLALLLLAAPLPATWSIVVVNTATNEVAVGTATCLTNFDIQLGVPVIVPGFGAGASQSLLDTSAINRRTIRRGLLSGKSPDEILLELQMINGFQARQFGVVNLSDTPITFTGNNAGAAKGGVVGVVGDLRYAIQGNVLTGDAVWLEAEKALVNTPGDLSQKLMAAMEAARAMGGDGRCSCSPSAPTSCGAPPVNGFTKSAHCAFVSVARIGDELGKCNSSVGCADGDFFLELNFVGAASDPDPVLVVADLYDAWRLGQVGVPDQVESSVVPSARALPADGVSKLEVHVALADLEGTPLVGGGDSIRWEQLSSGPASSFPLAVYDHGDGTYTLEIQASTVPGEDVFRLSANGVVLQPDVEVRVDALPLIHSGDDGVSAAAGADLPLVLNLGAERAGQPFHVVCAPSGAAALPFAPAAGPSFLVGAGFLDAEGRAELDFVAAPGLLEPFVGGELALRAIVHGEPQAVVGPRLVAVLP